jgi:hypothetical protein
VPQLVGFPMPPLIRKSGDVKLLRIAGGNISTRG